MRMSTCGAFPSGGFVVKILSCLLLAAMLTGCLPIGIRGSSLPYAGAPLMPGAGVPAIHYPA
jgi:hypothetical protein